MARARLLTLFCVCVSAAAQHLTLTDGEYYRMPPVFGLDEYEGCLATGGTYCLGSFELLPSTGQELYTMMRRFSENWIENFNHTRVHRGLCLPRCRAVAAAAAQAHSPQAWFASCVNESTTTNYGLSARLYHLDYCRRRSVADSGTQADTPLTANERAFIGVVATLLAFAAVSTILDLLLSDEAKKAHPWVLSWSIRGSWSMLAAPARAGGADSILQPLDGLRVICMLCVIIEHVCWIATLSFIADTRVYERMRWSLAGMLLANSTLVVQIFFMMSSFLLAHKLLSERRRGRAAPAFTTFRTVMLNRIIRISPNYYFVLWYASSVWKRAGGADSGADGGPLWQTLVNDEAAVCQKKWWTHLLYLNNVIYPDDKCLIQTWYLAADMQLYAVSLIATLVLGACSSKDGAHWRAVRILTGVLVATIVAVFALAYTHSLVPNFIIHNAESVRLGYKGVATFNQVYQSPLGNLPGALAGLLLAHAHHALLDTNATPQEKWWFRWLAVAGAPLAVLWAALCPLCMAAWPASRAAAAALAAMERPVFASLVAFAVLGAMHGVEMPWRSWLGWPGWATAARLSFGALLIHMPLNKLLVASRPLPHNLDITTAIFEWCGIAVLSYLAALPLALLVEFPAQRLYKALTSSTPAPKPPSGEKNQMGS